ncbi:GNAT family N-acetyltransferase [Streptacidiphilus sp. PB12-B1b]|uniref:GNAT family N-acetyltransferase n=1 Tax=Streptacidiphilus sp. PB12-B1b TaxID=2705012 RepID=UPI0015FC048E|nr:GNAT family N-acetyltransferase [Streptacidiphilus sp. PB12-B1b]QMU75849.1 GNAT family N-acetyltransferase [Streptacidiphilus sp. PB12-B1b]
MILRPVRDSASDARAVTEVSRAAFTAMEESLGAAPLAWTPAGVAVAEARTRHLAVSDPGGCWLAEEGGQPVGVALALRREGLWGLSLFCVLPSAQGKGLGRLLLDHAAAYGRGCLRGMVVAPPDPRAARRYHAAGFRLHPTMEFRGQVDRPALPDADGIPVHLGDASHRPLLDSVDRRVRGGAHAEDHPMLLRACEELLVVDTLAGSGYCYREGGRIVLLAATSRRLAARLLTEALIRVPTGVEAVVSHATGEQEWAVDVCLAAGLSVGSRGYLALRGMRPPAPYLPSDAYL